ncbi:MAG TPA: hypothetical protein VNK96_02850 [Fimbriimonadales bacterium]|nr:hypothetical protein [Fimbriimonadales bacterium]
MDAHELVKERPEQVAPDQGLIHELSKDSDPWANFPRTIQQTEYTVGINAAHEMGKAPVVPEPGTICILLGAFALFAKRLKRPRE